MRKIPEYLCPKLWDLTKPVQALIDALYNVKSIYQPYNDLGVNPRSPVLEHFPIMDQPDGKRMCYIVRLTAPEAKPVIAR